MGLGGTHIHATNRSRQEEAEVDVDVAREVFTKCIDHILTRLTPGTFRITSCGVPQCDVLEFLSDHRPVVLTIWLSNMSR